MKSSTHSTREVERDIQFDNPDFASSGPWELLVLALITLANSYLYLAVPKLSAQVYGAAATQTYRPVIPFLVLGTLAALRPARKESSKPVIYLALSSAIYALFLRSASDFFKHADGFVQSLNHSIVPLVAHAGALGLSSPFDLKKLLDISVPVIASSLVDGIFFLPLTIVLAGMIRQRARKTQLPAVISMSVLLAAALTSRSLMQRYELITAGNIFNLVLALSVLALASSRSFKAFFWSIACLSLVLWALRDTKSLACSTLPRLLHCHDTVGGFRILASQESITGRISVLENDKYRLLKADHSLLGGEWIGQGAGQSIFAAFYMQAQAIHALSKMNQRIQVLQIGLGIGTATKTLLEFSGPSSMSIEVVELDPIVIEYAHKYFGLPRPSADRRLSVHAMDALHFVQEAPDMSYDLISHDIFSGGGLAYALFTKQVFHTLKDKLKPRGILTVNFVYAPDVAELNFAAVVNTLKAVFDHVDIYIETGKIEKINNMVFFCSDSKMELDIRELGRRPRNTLEQTAQNMKNWRYNDLALVNETIILQDETIDSGASRRAMQDGELQMALTHWKLMRGLLPAPEDEIWTTV